MIGWLLNSEEANAAVVRALAGVILALVANGPGPSASRGVSRPAPERRAAA